MSIAPTPHYGAYALTRAAGTFWVIAPSSCENDEVGLEGSEDTFSVDTSRILKYLSVLSLELSRPGVQVEIIRSPGYSHPAAEFTPTYPGPLPFPPPTMSISLQKAAGA